MMKKLLAVLFIAALVSMAQATILELSFNGQLVDEAAMNPSEIAIIDVHASAVDGNAEFWLEILGQGIFEGNGVVFSPPAPKGVVADDFGYGLTYIYFRIEAPDPSFQPGDGVWYEVPFHCEGPETVVINLWDGNYAEILDTLVITQPEPMTVALLGLGGLFLRRRK
jgi:hypothetical protein